ncbi:MAG: HAMP domain-containing histidine kinase [Candidatus Obscuribacterales bacterium]|nr:HAMP domain-containing histidine kinase [Candidatus Obscuribacterales bacterium]
MFTSLRWRLTAFFVLAAAVIYLILASSEGLVMQQALDRALDEELQSIANEVETIIDLSNLDDELNRLKHSKNIRAFMPTIQLFDRKQDLLATYGPIKNLQCFPCRRPERILNANSGAERLRVLTRSIVEKNNVAWLQVTLSLRQRDLAISSYYQTFFLLSPLLLLGLAVSGYLFAIHATRPVEQSFAILRTFVADAGHELKTPLAILQANAEALAEGLSEAENSVPIIVRTCARMAELVDDLLLLAKLEAPKLGKKEQSCVNLFELSSVLQEEFMRLFETKNLSLSCQSQLDLLVPGNADEIHRALSNLLKNALNYTESGAVRLKIIRAGEHAEISVSDTGKGIPPESLARIFDRFYRVEKHRARSAGGSGLGLAIVKAIVERHGGSIKVKSKPAEGSTFIIELPLAS